MKRPPSGEQGFTLTEVLMGMLVMSIAVVAIIDGLTTMIGLGREHRGHSVLEAAAGTVAASTVAVAAGTSLREDALATATTLKVVDASLIPPPVAEKTYVTLGHEIVQIIGRSIGTNEVTVTRRVNGEAVTPASAGTRVTPVLRCPTPLQLEPTVDADRLPDGTSIEVTGVSYWQPGGASGTYVDRSACLTAYDKRCPPPEVLMECGFGLFRASVVARTTDVRLNGKTEPTVVLVRQGSR